MIEMILYGIGMFAVTLAIQFFLFKKNKGVGFWSGTEPIFIMCILGLLSNSAGDHAGILGYMIADYIGKRAGWHKTDKEKS